MNFRLLFHETTSFLPLPKVTWPCHPRDGRSLWLRCKEISARFSKWVSTAQTICYADQNCSEKYLRREVTSRTLISFSKWFSRFERIERICYHILSQYALLLDQAHHYNLQTYVLICPWHHLLCPAFGHRLVTLSYRVRQGALGSEDSDLWLNMMLADGRPELYEGDCVGVNLIFSSRFFLFFFFGSIVYVRFLDSILFFLIIFLRFELIVLVSIPFLFHMIFFLGCDAFSFGFILVGFWYAMEIGLSEFRIPVDLLVLLDLFKFFRLLSLVTSVDCVFLCFGCVALEVFFDLISWWIFLFFDAQSRIC
jgi:hypothetical protein